MADVQKNRMLIGAPSAPGGPHNPLVVDFAPGENPERKFCDLNRLAEVPSNVNIKRLEPGTLPPSFVGIVVQADPAPGV
jgi:hypothetical protein